MKQHIGNIVLKANSRNSKRTRRHERTTRHHNAQTPSNNGTYVRYASRLRFTKRRQQHADKVRITRWHANNKPVKKHHRSPHRQEFNEYRQRAGAY
ncbi:hypothetical protein AVEN_182047-1 [Araneus ventricosus]|uniref:Uncharacterized protein n=1 Tax=Araneus ventricosus TaxID=182803 RepID=A0A4Y2M848_ARAVE|nr:hypothetical protein AVEN_182047-1 [Araneus ventricosus]